MEQLINNSTVWAKLIIASQDAQISPIITREHEDIELTIVEADCPIELIIDAYTI